MKRLSVIIPMYKVEDYVERCIRSLENQDIPKTDYEIICINDGSPDNCRGVITKLQNEFSNIILIEQENKGVSIARNNGMNTAQGNYVLMIDPDDFILPNCLNIKMEVIEKLDLDVAYTGYAILDDSMKECYRYDLSLNDKAVVSGIDFFNKYEKGRTQIKDPDRSWAVFFRLQYLNDRKLRYLEDVPYLEDGEFMTRVICIAEHVSFLNDPFYIRTTRHGSATHSGLFFTEKAREGFLKAAQNLVWFKDIIATTVEQKAFLNYQILHFVMLHIISLNWLNFFLNYKRLNNNLKTGSLRYLETDGCTSFYLRMGQYYNCSLQWFYLNWRIYLAIQVIRNRFKMLKSIF